MMKTRIAALGLSILGITSGLTGCSEQPAVCDDLDALRASIDNVRDAKLGENALSTISTEVEKMKTDAEALADDAADEFATEAEAVREGTDTLMSDVDAAQADPSAATLGEVGESIQALGTALENLVDKVGNTC